MTKLYDIFISYRRKDTGDKAEHLKDLLDSKYKGRISFDRENLTGLFDVALIRRIDKCKDFLLVVGKKSLSYEESDFSTEQVELYNHLATCTEEEFEQKIIEMGCNAPIDFVRIEIARALHRKNINIIPVVPEKTDAFDFSKLSLPPDIMGIKRYEAVTFSDNPDALFKDVVPKLLPRLSSKPNSHMAFLLLSLLIAVAVALGMFHYYSVNQEKRKYDKALKALMKNEINNFVLEWSKETTLLQAEAVNDILNKMEPVDGGTFMMGTIDDDVEAENCLETPPIQQSVESFYIGRYEVTKSQWCKILEIPYSPEEANYPISNVSLDDCVVFCDSLYFLTGLNFDLPTEAEWEYAARGGIKPNNTRYSGSDSPDEVAWYEKNSQKKPHECDGRTSGLYCNSLNLFDMSGNVSEWCLWTDSIHRLYCDMKNQTVNDKDVIYNSGVSIARGGNYLSQPYELTVFHRETPNRNNRSSNIGLRLIIRK